jgi:DNA processing protein
MSPAIDDAAYWLGLSLIPGVGSETLRQLLHEFGTPEQVYATPSELLRKVVSEHIAQHIAQGPDQAAIAPMLAWLGDAQNHLITLADATYPKALLEIPDPPPLLYVKGRIELLNMPALAIVGSRNASPQGEKNAEEFAQSLSDAGYCIISGLALGIDGAAHRGALRGSAGTVAVVGTGLDIVYPARHRGLAHDIATQGALISEFPLGTPSRAQNFPRRNRIISGLARGCLVVEANLQSGSLITARLATEQGREVFALPGSIHSPLSKGCHLLIKQGAKLVDSIQDILEELGGAPISLVADEGASDLTGNDPLLQCMGFDAITLDTLIQQSGLTGETVSAMLLVLELEGKVACLPGGRYQRLG